MIATKDRDRHNLTLDDVHRARRMHVCVCVCVYAGEIDKTVVDCDNMDTTAELILLQPSFSTE